MSKYSIVHSVKVATDFTPETFGRLTTIGPKFMLPDNKGRDRRYQVCQCICGTMRICLANDLKRGHTESCGCLSIESHTSHGMTYTPEYKAWSNLTQRCNNPNNKDYANYGGRGIRVCDRWLDPENGFVNFLADMGIRPPGARSVERKLVDGNYCPENCKWATNKEQARNKRNNQLVAYNGITQCVTAWEEELGVSRDVLRNRLKAGWSIHKAMSTPPRKITNKP